MKTLFEAHMDLFSPRPKATVTDWIALDSRWDITGFFVKNYEIKTATKSNIKAPMELKIHRISPTHAIVEVFSIVYINDDGNNSTLISNPDLESIENSIAWNEWVDLPPDLVEDMMKEVTTWFERANKKVGFFS